MYYSNSGGHMKLCNFSNTDYHLAWYDNNWQGLIDFLNENQLDGIELLLHGNYEINNIPKQLVKGLHLSYFPTWLDFFNEDEIYKHDFPEQQDLMNTFEGVTPEAIVERFKKDYEVAKALEVEYMVYHVAHVRLKDAFSFTYEYSNEDVLNATAKIVNQIFDHDSDVELLFENLWWPGLQLLCKDELNAFMSKIDYKKKGVMLDLSHLIITNNQLKTLDDAVLYILECLSNLGEAIKWIKGIHINKTLIHEYMLEDHQLKYTSYLNAENNQRFKVIYDHISKLDQHMPFDHIGLKDIIALVNPKYKMIEVVGHNRDIWESYVKEQLEYL